MSSIFKHRSMKSESIIIESTGGFGDPRTKKLCLRCNKPFNSKRKKGLLYDDVVLQHKGAFCKNCTKVFVNKYGDEIHKHKELTLLA